MRPGRAPEAALWADEMLQGGLWSAGELRSLAELLEEMNDGEDREDREEVPDREHTEESAETSGCGSEPDLEELRGRSDPTFITALHLHFRVFWGQLG